MSVVINPRRLHGPWNDGYALDFHTLQSTFSGMTSMATLVLKRPAHLLATRSIG